MAILQAFGVHENFGPVWRARTFVLARLTSFNCDTDDLRWTVAALAMRVLGAAWAFGLRQLDRWARSVLRRAWQGARFAADPSDADSMVAAGGR
jgi:hypothetical protein